MKHACAIGLLSLMLTCGSPRPQPPWDQAVPLKLGAQSYTALTTEQPISCELAAPTTWGIALGNPGDAPLELAVTQPDGKQTSLTLPAKAWKMTTLAGGKQPLVLDPGGQPLLVAKPVPLSGEKNAARKNVLLISIDTLRYDVFTQEMPELNKLLTTHFTRTYTTAPWTLPSHASLFTGTYPTVHKVRKPDQKLGPQLPTLAEQLAAQGYYCLAVTEGNFVSSDFGLARGFHFYSENSPQMMATSPQSITQLDQGLALLNALLDQHQASPVFAFFHTYEVHCPYLERDDQGQIGTFDSTQVLLDMDGKPQMEAALPRLRRAYRNEARYTDKQLAPLVKRLLDSGDWYVALVADHGEEFGEHGGLLHGDNLYEEAAHVPFVMGGPGLEAGPMNRLLSLIDVPSTLLARLEIPAPAVWQGHDALAQESGRTWVFAESFFFGVHQPSENARLQAVWYEKEKLIQTRLDRQTKTELFDLASDPKEGNNLEETQIQQLDRFFKALDAYSSSEGGHEAETLILTEEQQQIMRGLGYLK